MKIAVLSFALLAGISIQAKPVDKSQQESTRALASADNKPTTDTVSDGYGFEVDAQKQGKIMMRYEYFKAAKPGSSVDRVTFKLRCPPKHYAVGGGCQTNDNKEILFGSYAETNGRDPSGWVCVFSGFGADTMATVQAHCQ